MSTIPQSTTHRRIPAHHDIQETVNRQPWRADVQHHILAGPHTMVCWIVQPGEPLAAPVPPTDASASWPVMETMPGAGQLAMVDTTQNLQGQANEVNARAGAAEHSGAIEPAWELDALLWPEVFMKLENAVGKALRRDVQELKGAVQEGLRVLAVSALSPGAGRTTVALLLARYAARAGIRSCVVESDFARPAMAQIFGIRCQCHWPRALTRGEPIAEHMIRVLDEGLDLALLGEREPAGGTLQDHRLQMLLASLRKGYDLIVIDAPLVVPQWHRKAPAGNSLIDAVLLVRDVRREESLAPLPQAIASLRQWGIPGVALAENFLPQPRGRA